MRVCPKCGFTEPECWRPARWDNPDGELDVCRFEDFKELKPEIASKLNLNRNQVFTDNAFAYIIGKRAIYVKRVRKCFYEWGGTSAFKVPWENSKTGEQRNL